MDVKQQFTNALTLIQSRIERLQGAYAQSYDRMARDVSYKVGDQVLKLCTTGKHGLTPKLLPIHDGPFFVMNVNYPDLTIWLETDQEDTVHVNQLRRYVSPDQPNLTDRSTNGNSTH
uniref:Uncharacterized protein n=1 Tax=Romanomermis culicivorax TaxID=13658 RepID=A0A915KKI2_ROMCU